MQIADYTAGDAFQAEKRTIFARQWLPLCAEGQIGRPGDFLAASVGGWGVFAVRDGEGTVRVLRNACRHQNMQVVGTASGNCHSFRCRFHGWTYDLQGRFLNAPAPVAPKDLPPADLDLVSLGTEVTTGMVFFGIDRPEGAPEMGAPLPAYVGTRIIDIACNWKVCIEHLLAQHEDSPEGSPDFAWCWPLLTVRRTGRSAIVSQIVPHTFLRTRLFAHVFGDSADDHDSWATEFKQACENLQVDLAGGALAFQPGARVAEFHRRMAATYALDRATT